jgi:hypothetical protein
MIGFSSKVSQATYSHGKEKQMSEELTLVRYGPNDTPPNCILCRKRQAAYYELGQLYARVCHYCLINYVKAWVRIIGPKASPRKAERSSE